MTPLLALHHLFADTLEIEQAGMEEAVVHYPLEYDFEDFWGREGFSNLFVSKLLATGSGQCYSLPQLYLLLAEELGSKAWLSLSPNHSYIKFKDTEDQWYNLELPNGNIVSESWMLASGYVTVESIQNGIYMDTLSLEETVAMKMVDLAKGYERKYGIQDGTFILKTVNRALEVNPNLINALLLKAETQKELFEEKMLLKSIDDPNVLIEQDEHSRDLFLEMQSIYTRIHQLGFRQMPEEMYLDWLRSLEKEKEKYQNKNLTH